MIAGFQDAALTNKEDAVAALDGGKTVGNDEAGAPLEQGFDALLEETLGLGVDGGGRLVQDQDFGIGKQGTGKGDELLLSLA